MEDRRLFARSLIGAEAYINSLPSKDKSKILAGIASLQKRDFDILRTKQLRGPVRELIVNDHRITYFSIGNVLYLVRGFRKKGAKTPKAEIEYAENVYLLLTKKKI